MIKVKEELGIKHFMTLDSTLTLDRKLIVAISNELIERNVGITWEGQTRANLVDRELLVLLKRSGLVRLSFGVESADPEVLRLMKKEVPVEAMREAFRLCKELGISTLCGTMMGNPGDTRKSILRTAWFVRSIPEIRYAPIAIAIPYPGTELMDMAEKNMYGLKLLSKDYRNYSRYAGGVMEIDGMKPEELLKLQRRALLIAHLTLRKIFGLFQHFGFFNVFKMGMKFVKSEFVILLGGRETLITDHVGCNNTTIRSLTWMSFSKTDEENTRNT
jgi:radical SAM superfamily enzyme YgiQ (UPF0313 family)